MNFLKDYGYDLIKQGYDIVPIMKNKKYPVIPGWQELQATSKDVDHWLANGHRDGGVGILCKNTVAIDIDCYDKDKNKKLVMWLEKNIGTAPVRYGNYPKCIVAYKVDKPFSKSKSSEYTDATGQSHAVEVLASGQQFVAYGMHPTTKKKYRWNPQRGSLINHKHSTLPTITKEKAQAFIDYFHSIANEEPMWELARKSILPIVDTEYLTTLKPKVDMDDTEVSYLLSTLDPDMHHDDWLRVGMALHHQYDGKETGADLWEEWSQTGVKHKSGECLRRYFTFDLKGRTPITLATVKNMEKQSIAEKAVEDRLPRMLKEWAFVQVEGSARVIREDVHKGNVVLFKLEDLKKENMNCRIMSGGEKPKLTNLVDMWLEHPDRRTYAAGLAFAPDMQILDRYNLWRGWSIEPKKGDVTPWLKFVTDVIASGNEISANYIITWSAQLVQEPMNKIGVGLVLRGQKGTGKTKFGELLGGLFKPHHQIVSRSEHVTGKFNRHLEHTLLLQADEAYFAGAKSSEGALKDLLTNPEITIERKSVDAYTVANYTRILFTSNEEFVVPATLEERRFAVFDVSVCKQQQSRYFAELQNWYNAGGASALLYYLQTFNIATTNLRLVPQTTALQDQKLEALNSVNQWFFNCLQNGEIRENRVAGITVAFGSQCPKANLYDIYCSSIKSKYEVPVKEVAFWRYLNAYEGVFTLGKYARIGDSRIRHVEIASLQDARKTFNKITRLKVEFTPIDDIQPDGVFEESWSD